MKVAEIVGQPEGLKAPRPQQILDGLTLEINRNMTLTIQGKVIWLRLSSSGGFL